MATSEVLGSKVHLGVSPLSWTNDVLAELGGEIPLEVCLQEAAEIGYEGVELGRKFPRSAHELLPKLSNYGLRLVTGWHSGFLTERSVEEEWAAAADHVQLLEDCGCAVLVYGECGLMEGDSPWDEPLSRRTRLRSIDLEAYAAKLGEFSVGLSKRGIKLAYHYHLKMLVETGAEIAAFCQATRPEVGLLLDTGHAYAAGADYGEILRRFGDRVVHIHLKDVRPDVLQRARKSDLTFNSAVRDGLFTVPGDGAVDFSEIGKFVRSSGYSGWVVVEAEQDPAKAEPRVYAGKAYRCVKDLLFSSPPER
jgi:inosose dehydratase